jgi:hypothetical protein
MERSPGGPWEINRQLALLAGAGVALLAPLMVEQHRPEMVLRLALTAGVALAVRAAHPPNRPIHTLFELALLLSIAAAAAGWYAQWWPSTWLAHFTTAAFAGAVLFDLLSRDAQWRASKGSAVLLTTALGLAAASVWEIYEWFARQTFARPGIIADYSDTIGDLAIGGVGALCASLVLLRIDANRGKVANIAETRAHRAPRQRELLIHGWCRSCRNPRSAKLHVARPTTQDESHSSPAFRSA